MLGHARARRCYDWFGARQDAQGFYENAALDALVRHASFETAGSVLEPGCGTGRFARRLLDHHLPDSARYVALDISETMVDLARRRLAPWAGRAEVVLSDGALDLSPFGMRFDRILCTHVFDLLSDGDIATLLEGAHGAATPGGLLCTAGLTRGIGPASRLVSTLWNGVHRFAPVLVGGCRPLVLADALDPAAWCVRHREVVVSAAVPSEVTAAEVMWRRAPGRDPRLTRRVTAACAGKLSSRMSDRTGRQGGSPLSAAEGWASGQPPRGQRQRALA